ncbi:uncharacterized protein J3D65DRAFT_447911 [Phyllosticta citribraziliensis]|uniref:Uncharacterized protein n=1 Tax=Phyllosticta citribraziliensis TaxID=989973 RepID=A0ABR1LNJ4_9PEZI
MRRLARFEPMIPHLPDARRSLLAYLLLLAVLHARQLSPHGGNSTFFSLFPFFPCLASPCCDSRRVARLPSPRPHGAAKKRETGGRRSSPHTSSPFSTSLRILLILLNANHFFLSDFLLVYYPVPPVPSFPPLSLSPHVTGSLSLLFLSFPLILLYLKCEHTAHDEMMDDADGRFCDGERCALFVCCWLTVVAGPSGVEVVSRGRACVVE